MGLPCGWGAGCAVEQLGVKLPSDGMLVLRWWLDVLCHCVGPRLAGLTWLRLFNFQLVPVVLRATGECSEYVCSVMLHQATAGLWFCSWSVVCVCSPRPASSCCWKTLWPLCPSPATCHPSCPASVWLDCVCVQPTCFPIDEGVCGERLLGFVFMLLAGVGCGPAWRDRRQQWHGAGVALPLVLMPVALWKKRVQDRGELLLSLAWRKF